MEPSKFVVAYVGILVYQKKNCQLLFATTFWLQTFMNKKLFSNKQITINNQSQSMDEVWCYGLHVNPSYMYPYVRLGL
jgi:hypothetical protein